MDVAANTADVAAGWRPVVDWRAALATPAAPTAAAATAAAAAVVLLLLLLLLLKALVACLRLDQALHTICSHEVRIAAHLLGLCLRQRLGGVS